MIHAGDDGGSFDWIIFFVCGYIRSHFGICFRGREQHGSLPLGFPIDYSSAQINHSAADTFTCVDASCEIRFAVPIQIQGKLFVFVFFHQIFELCWFDEMDCIAESLFVCFISFCCRRRLSRHLSHVAVKVLFFFFSQMMQQSTICFPFLFGCFFFKSSVFFCESDAVCCGHCMGFVKSLVFGVETFSKQVMLGDQVSFFFRSLFFSEFYFWE